LSVAAENGHQQHEFLAVGILADHGRKVLCGSHLQECNELARPAGFEPATLGLEGEIHVI
jgi:hypothetical protein